MGFDPRHWSGGRPEQRVTSNVEALLAENDALRREVSRLNRELERLQRQQRQRFRTEHSSYQPWSEPSAQSPPRISCQYVQAWGQALAQQPGWTALRQRGLESLLDQINRSSFPAQLTLEQRLDRLVPGLGTDLIAAVGDTPNNQTTAVLAAFALFGVRASEWLDEDPRRVVEQLRQRQDQSGSKRQGRRTRTDQRQTDRQDYGYARDPRSAALKVLGLDANASLAEIKQAHRKLVKQHHPDLGGSAEAFRRVNEAYQALVQ
mgnify:FL=1